MNLIKSLRSTGNSQLFYFVFMVGAIFLISIGLLIYNGIQTKVKVFLFDLPYKHRLV